MKPRTSPACTLLLALTSVVLPLAVAAASPTYQNPVIPGNLADPAVIRHDGVYYLYATGEVDGDHGTRVYTSTNLVDWQRGPVVFQPGQPHVWAPDVWRDPDSGRFYLYYTVNQTVGVAEADGPLGPFTLRRKFFDHAIDAHLFRDDDAKLYLYFVQLPGFRITVQPMASPTEPAGEPKLILQPEAEWEKRAGHVTEGPWMIKRQGRYYLLYSGSGADTPDYAVGYATADSPLGPFTRAAHNPIVRRAEGLFGPGHGCAVQDAAGQWWHVYHQKRSDRIEWDRFIAVDPLWFDQHGDLHSRATRGTMQARPAADAAPRLRQDFADPPQRYWPRPLWFWNNTRVTVETVKEQMRQARDRCRYGGFGILPFGKGFFPAYLSDEYFAVYGAALEQAKALGLTLSLYDEYGFPSGSAGSQNSSDTSLFAQRWPELTIKRLDKHEWEITGPARFQTNVPTGKLAALVAMNITNLQRVDLTDTVRAGRLDW
ncbi:MAG: glycoside hydrolase family 43 protein, partial [Verrucomicrobiota bacterium]